MQVALAWFLCGGERERREERGRGGEIVPRILRENYSFSWRWGVGKTTLPCSINCCLRETDILGGGMAGFGNVSNLSKWKWQRTLQLSTSLYCGRLELKHLKVFVAKLVWYIPPNEKDFKGQGVLHSVKGGKGKRRWGGNIPTDSSKPTETLNVCHCLLSLSKW